MIDCLPIHPLNACIIYLPTVEPCTEEWLTLIFLLIKNMGVEARMVVVSNVSKW
jgi:hypothetical protein